MIDASYKKGSRCRQPALALFLASPAMDTIKVTVQAILPKISGYALLDETVIGSDHPDLMKQILALTPAGLDFFRLLRDEKPATLRHSRQHVSAALRAKCRVPRGKITPADFPAGHHVPLLADIFWGGIVAWAEAAPSRSQKPKGYWQVRENQIAALQSFREHQPGSSITLATLSAAGFHALATSLPADMLEEVAREAGVSRMLRCKPAGFWDAAATIEAYVALCDQAGIPLTNHLLTKAGGHGFTIRSQVRKLFGTFHSFRAKVGDLHPWLGPNARPMTSDGLSLDSFQEVAVYERLRRMLPPGTRIVPHILLGADLPRRSADFLVDAAVYVEVLMISLADMESPTSRTQRQYEAKWRCKADWYAKTAKPLVIIEPNDVLRADRLAERVDEVLRLLGPATSTSVANLARCSDADSGTVRPKGYWTFDTLCKVVAEVGRTVGGFPTHADLNAAGYHTAPTMLTRLGRGRVADRIGLPLRNEKNVWNPERIEQEIAVWVNKYGRFPSVADLKATGHSHLAGARQRLFNGKTDELRHAVERICERPLARRKMPNGSYATQELLAAILRPLCARLGSFPTRAEVRAAGLPPAVWARVSTDYGVRRMAAFMGVPCWDRRRKCSDAPASPRSGGDLFTGLDAEPQPRAAASPV